MIGQVRIGVDYVVRDNASITFVFFIAATVLAVMAARFSYYAYLNSTTGGAIELNALWWTLTLAGIAGFAYAVLGLLDVMTSLQTPYRRGFMLAYVAGVAAGMARIGREASPDDDQALRPGSALLWPASVGAVVVVLFGTAWNLDHWIVAAFEGVAGLAFALVGLVVLVRTVSSARVSGTVLDTLLRHLFPVLLFGTMVPATSLAVAFGQLAGVPVLNRALLFHVEVVFVVMTATALMTATIRLRQNLAGL